MSFPRFERGWEVQETMVEKSSQMVKLDWILRCIPKEMDSLGQTDLDQSCLHITLLRR